MATQTPTPNQRRLQKALGSLKLLQESGLHVYKSAELARGDRESLERNGFIRPILKGWYMPSHPGERDGETTAWYASAKEFIVRYCEEKFGEDWCVSPEYSLQLHAGNTILPPQVIVYSAAAQNGLIELPAGHSLLTYRAPDMPPRDAREMVGSLRVMQLEEALARAPEAFFKSYPEDAQIALLSLRDVGGLALRLFQGAQPTQAGRLAGAFRACGQGEQADRLIEAAKVGGYKVVEGNPFERAPTDLKVIRGESPYATRIRQMWARMREDVIAQFPAAPGLPTDAAKYLAAVKDAYMWDAYNSLSIEGYRVSEDLIERVATGAWNPEANEDDKNSKDTMAARGYHLARTAVEASIAKILAGEIAGTVAARDHRAWFARLVQPSVEAGIVRAEQMLGYRRSPVYIRNAKHVPPPFDAVVDMMEVMFEQLTKEPEASVRAVLGHFVFVFIHPYTDGNGRMGRFLMNAMMASGGYPWTVVELARRTEYMQALDLASDGGNIVPFAQFIAASMACAVDASTAPSSV